MIDYTNNSEIVARKAWLYFFCRETDLRGLSRAADVPQKAMTSIMRAEGTATSAQMSKVVRLTGPLDGISLERPRKVVCIASPTLAPDYRSVIAVGEVRTLRNYYQAGRLANVLGDHMDAGKLRDTSASIVSAANRMRLRLMGKKDLTSPMLDIANLITNVEDTAIHWERTSEDGYVGSAHAYLMKGDDHRRNRPSVSFSMNAGAHMSARTRRYALAFLYASFFYAPQGVHVVSDVTQCMYTRKEIIAKIACAMLVPPKGVIDLQLAMGVFATNDLDRVLAAICARYDVSWVTAVESLALTYKDKADSNRIMISAYNASRRMPVSEELRFLKTTDADYRGQAEAIRTGM